MATDRFGDAEPHITCDGWDDVAILLCPRQSCMRPLESGLNPYYWTTEIDHLTPEQVIAVRDKHVKEMHR